METIRDLIEIPEVETVIQVSSLARSNESDRKRRFVDTFIITDDIMGGLHAIFTSLTRDTGSGFLVKGGYGSGKSHFIAFVGSILLHPHLAAEIGNEHTLVKFAHTISSKTALPVFITLTDYPATSGLSDIIIDAIADACIDAGMKNPLAETAGIFEDFSCIMLPALAEKFDDYLSKNNIYLEKLTEPEKNSAVLRFLKECNIPFRPHYDYRKLFERIAQIVSEKFSAGIFLLIDELSEFLRARSRPELISEDIRFIQFLGEFAFSSQLRILFSMQEAIEEVADITAESLNRVKDRYPVRINLTAFHLRELVEKRLLIKKSGAYSVIDAIHARLCDSFPQLKISRDEFRAIFPIHPSTFEMLESIAGLFSKTRGLVDFIVSEIAGDRSRSIPGMLDEPAEKLLLPDRIFDHFRNNLQESIQYNRMVSVIFDSAERAIASFFKKENDAAVALRAAKLVVLHQIMPNKKSPSALELANLLIENRFYIDPDINYTFIRDKIMKGLEQIWPFLRCQRGNSPLEDRFYLTGEESPLNRFEKASQQFIQTVPHPEKQALWHFISRFSNDELPLSDIKNSQRPARLQFENTTREGLVFLKDPSAFSGKDVDALNHKLLHDEYDFAVIIGFPTHEKEEFTCFKELCASITPPFSESIFYWKPRIPDDRERQTLKGHFARMRTAESGNIPLDDKAVRERVEESKKEGFGIIKALYSEGSLYSLSESKLRQHDLLFTTNFDKTAELFARDALKRTFPSHSKIMPTAQIASPETFNQIIMLFREKSEIDFNFEGSRMIKNAIDCLLKGSGIFAINHSQYKIAPDPSKNQFVKDLLFTIEKNLLPFEELYFQFRKGRYGIQKNLFCLYLFFLSSSGYITLKRGGRALRSSSLDLRIIQFSEEIVLGEELSSLFLEKYHLLGRFAEGLKPKNIHLQAQEAVWDKLVTFKRLEEDRIVDLLEKLNSLESFPLFSKNPLHKSREAIENIIVFLKKIKPGKTPKDGLNDLLAALPENINLENDLAVVKHFDHFINGQSDQVLFIYNYLTSPDLYLGENEELKHELMSLLERMKEIDMHIAAGMVEGVIQNFLAFREKYARTYEAHHSEIHPPDTLTDFDNIRLSPLYRVLATLHQIEMLSITHDITLIEQTLSAISASICKRKVARELNEKPYCECRLQKSDIKITPNEMRLMIRKGIEEYFYFLKSDEVRKKISSFCGALLTSGETDKRDILKSLLEVDPTKTTENDLLRMVTKEAMLLVNRALSTNILVVEKDIEELQRLFEERRGTRADLVRIFCEWLDQNILPGKEILYHITGSSKEKQKPFLPNIAIEALRKAFPGKSDELLLKALSLSQFPPKPADNEFHSLVSKLTHLEMSGESIRQFMDAHSDFIPSDVQWELLFNENDRAELLAAIDLDNKKSDELAEIYNIAKGFPSIRTDIIARLLSESATLSQKSETRFEIDDSNHGALLLSTLHFRSAQKNYFRESARCNEFNGSLFQHAFEAMFETEKIYEISINKNIAPEKIASTALALKREIVHSCAKIFNEKISHWETEPSSMVASIHEFIRSANSPLVLLFDAMRYDLFLSVLPVFIKSGWKNKKAKFFLSPLPSNTEAFRNALFPNIELANGLEFAYQDNRYIFLSAAEREYRREALISLLEENPDASLLFSIGILDEKIHGTTQGTGSIGAELALFCEQTIMPLLNSFPLNRDIIVLNDHGFIGNPHYAQKNEPRYSHGGNSFQERIIFSTRFIKA